MRLFDTHTHLTDDRFDQDREQLLQELPGKGVELVVDCATSPQDWEKVSRLGEGWPYIYVAYGVHAHNAGDDCVRGGYLEGLRERLKEPKCVAIGEIGLDYHYDFCPRDRQLEVLHQQLELAVELDLPVILHDREAHGDMLAALKKYAGRLRGVMHCYSGSAEMLREYAGLELYFGFGGTVTFKNAEKTRKAAAAVPACRILLETDCPYLTPVPHRSRRNDPSMTALVCEKLAELKGIDGEAMAQMALDNGKRLFNIN